MLIKNIRSDYRQVPFGTPIHIKCSRQVWMVPTNKMIEAGTVPTNKMLKAGTVPPNKILQI